MKREEANETLQRASQEQRAILRAQWEILSASSWNLLTNRRRSKKTTCSMTRSRGTGCGAIEF